MPLTALGINEGKRSLRWFEPFSPGEEGVTTLEKMELEFLILDAAI
jgi:hypothetical protein